jgi:hypothetical protein
VRGQLIQGACAFGKGPECMACVRGRTDFPRMSQHAMSIADLTAQTH